MSPSCQAASERRLAAGAPGGRGRQAVGLGRLAVVIPAGRDLAEGLIQLDAVEQLARLGAVQQPLGDREPRAQDVAPHLALDGSRPAALGFAQFLGALVGCDAGLAEQLDRHRHRALGLGGTAGPALHRQAIDPLRARMVGIVRHPGLELLVFRAIGGRVHVALIEHVAHEDPVLEAGDALVGGLPIATLLESEDLAIEPLVVGTEGARQAGRRVRQADRRLGELRLRNRRGCPGKRQQAGGCQPAGAHRDLAKPAAGSRQKAGNPNHAGSPP